MKKILECIPNISEGKNQDVIKKIASEIYYSKNVKLLNIDRGEAANRTVITFAGHPDAIVNAAFRLVKKASELIDMSTHRGEHPRIGATDVCPLVPVANISMEETVKYAHQLAERIGNELNIPVYCYEYAASHPRRKNLANIRSGEYERLPVKLKDPQWKPDYGPAEFNKRSGATVVGARDFLIAYNINLNTTSTQVANEIAYDIREKGRIKREGDPVKGKIARDNNGKPVYIKGLLRSLKALGWYIEEYGMAQVSMNITNTSITPIHVVYEEVCKRAEQYNVKVTGSELVGLIPLKCMLNAGRHFLNKENKGYKEYTEAELIKAAIDFMGLDHLRPFNPDEKIIEYTLNNDVSKNIQVMV